MSQFKFTIPCELEFVPALRQLIFDMARSYGHDEHFCFRVKVIADELCNNAIQHGAQDIDSKVHISAEITNDNLMLSVQDEGGSKRNLENLKRAITKSKDDKPISPMRGRGLEIVQMLGDKLEIRIDQKGFTEVRAVKEQAFGKLQENPK